MMFEEIMELTRELVQVEQDIQEVETSNLGIRLKTKLVNELRKDEIRRTKEIKSRLGTPVANSTELTEEESMIWDQIMDHIKLDLEYKLPINLKEFAKKHNITRVSSLVSLLNKLGFYNGQRNNDGYPFAYGEDGVPLYYKVTKAASSFGCIPNDYTQNPVNLENGELLYLTEAREFLNL